MKKTILALSVISALTSTSSLATTSVLLANTKDTNANDTETMVITANRTLENKFDVLAAVDVFDRDSIEQLQPASVADLLNRIAGINVISGGTKANNSSVFVRGGNSDHVLILLNGVRVGSATIGVKSLSSVSLELIDRVEVVRGPRASLWGSDAIGGVIQIFTRQFAENTGQVGLKLGSNNSQEIYASVGLGNEQHSYTLSASKEKSDGYDIKADDETDKDGFDNESFAVNGTSRVNQYYSVELNAQLEQGNTEFDTSWGGNQADFKKHHFLVRNHIQLEHAYVQFSYANSRDNEVTFGNNALPALFETKRDQLSALTQLSLSEQSEVVIGADWYNEKINTSEIYNDDTREANAIYLTTRQQLDALKLEASVRRDEVGDVDTEITYQLGAGYDLSQDLMVALTYGTSFKAPTFNDLYYPWGGNENLVSETASNTELITRYKSDNFQAELSIYNTDFDDLIEWAPDANGNWQPSNIASASIQGAEATVTGTLFNVSHRLSLTHLDAKDDATGQQLARRPYFTANYSVTFTGDNWDASVELDHQGSRYDDKYHSTHLPSHTLVNLAANIEISSALKVVFSAHNITDKDYQPTGGYYGRPQTVNVGIDYRF
ncbi:TonB-dependent receptor [Colwelliaceae bacterium 6471]